MSEPTISTVKRLFALSGNLCAFPNCTITLVDEASEKVTGKICHIKGRQPRSKRHDPNQSNTDRHSFENLILLCPIHHDVVDSDDVAYTVERLMQMKKQHEKTRSCGKEPSDEIASKLIQNIESNIIVGGSVIISQNQKGGQVAHSIVNIGTQSRTIHQAVANELIAELMKRQHEVFEIISVCDAEAVNLGEALKSILENAGWKCESLGQAFFAPPQPRGVIMQVPEIKESFQILLDWMINIGLNPKGEHNHASDKIKIIIGSHL